MALFQENVELILKNFDDGKRPIFSDEELDCLNAKQSKMFDEGCKIWRGHSGVYSQNGQIIFTKCTLNLDITQFICEMIKLINFPGYISFDGHGFVKSEEGMAFQFASCNSTIRLHNEKQAVNIHDSKTKENLFYFFKSMTDDNFLQRWFKSHDEVGDLISSGFVPRRIVNLVIYFEPTHTNVNEIFQLGK